MRDGQTNDKQRKSYSAFDLWTAEFRNYGNCGDDSNDVDDGTIRMMTMIVTMMMMMMVMMTTMMMTMVTGTCVASPQRIIHSGNSGKDSQQQQQGKKKHYLTMMIIIEENWRTKIGAKKLKKAILVDTRQPTTSVKEESQFDDDDK